MKLDAFLLPLGIGTATGIETGTGTGTGTGTETGTETVTKKNVFESLTLKVI